MRALILGHRSFGLHGFEQLAVLQLLRNIGKLDRNRLHSTFLCRALALWHCSTKLDSPLQLHRGRDIGERQNLRRKEVLHASSLHCNVKFPLFPASALCPTLLRIFFLPTASAKQPNGTCAQARPCAQECTRILLRCRTSVTLLPATSTHEETNAVRLLRYFRCYELQTHDAHGGSRVGLHGNPTLPYRRPPVCTYILLGINIIHTSPSFCVPAGASI
jgi:hypothetical protein